MSLRFYMPFWLSASMSVCLSVCLCLSVCPCVSRLSDCLPLVNIFFSRFFFFHFCRISSDKEPQARIRRDPNGYKLPMSPSCKYTSFVCVCVCCCCWCCCCCCCCCFVFTLFFLRRPVSIKTYADKLTTFEQSEILDYPDVWYLGLEAKKIEGVPGAPQNNGMTWHWKYKHARTRARTRTGIRFVLKHTNNRGRARR